jgi:hypothetical protein
MDDRGYGDQVKRGVASAVDTASDLAGKAQSAAAQAGSTIQGAASETVRQVRDAAAKGAQAADYLSRNTAEQPLLALLLAGAVGYAIAYLIHSR